VFDHCPRNLLTLSEVDASEVPTAAANSSRQPLKATTSSEGSPGASAPSSTTAGVAEECHAWLTLLQNHESRTVEWLVAFASGEERSRWRAAVTPARESTANPDERIYEDWDCPRVEAAVDIDGGGDDRLGMRRGDTANVLRKLSDSGKLTRFIRAWTGMRTLIIYAKMRCWQCF